MSLCISDLQYLLILFMIIYFEPKHRAPQKKEMLTCRASHIRAVLRHQTWLDRHSLTDSGLAIRAYVLFDILLTGIEVPPQPFLRSHYVIVYRIRAIWTGSEVLGYVGIESINIKNRWEEFDNHWIELDLIYLEIVLKPRQILDRWDPSDLARLPEANPVSEPSCSARGDHALCSLHQMHWHMQRGVRKVCTFKKCKSFLLTL